GSNQRLELLVNAVLELTATLYYYYQKYPDTPANDFRTFKGSILSNDAFDSLFASFGLDTLLNTILADTMNGEVKLKKYARRDGYLRNLGITDWVNLDFSKALGSFNRSNFKSSIDEERKFVEDDDEEITSVRSCWQLAILISLHDVVDYGVRTGYYANGTRPHRTSSPLLRFSSHLTLKLGHQSDDIQTSEIAVPVGSQFLRKCQRSRDIHWVQERR
ncbi:hypothetical protein BGX21_006924, partial [Mortierella sp. AD011]